jgi:hypothetical protein
VTDSLGAYGVAVLPALGEGEFATGEVEVYGWRGVGQGMFDRAPRFYVTPKAGGTVATFESYEEAREHASAAVATDPLGSSGMLIFKVLPDRRIILEEIPERPRRAQDPKSHGR